MSANRRHGGHILPNEVSFPPASGQGYYNADAYSDQSYANPQPVDPSSGQHYYVQPTAPPQNYYTGHDDPYPPGAATRPMHGGHIEPTEAWPEQQTQEKQPPSPESIKSRKKLRKASRPSTEEARHEGRHGGNFTPSENVDSITQYNPAPVRAPRPPPVPLGTAQSYHSRAPSYATQEQSFKEKAQAQAHTYSVTSPSSNSVPGHQLSYSAPVPVVGAASRRKLHQHGYRNVFNSATRFRWFKSVHFHRKADLKYSSAQQQLRYRHRDAVGRVHEGTDMERLISTRDVHLGKAMIQCADSIYESDTATTWRRTFIRNMSPMMIRLANWPTNAVPVHRKDWQSNDWTRVVLIWPLACMGLCIAFLKIGHTYSWAPPNMKYPAFVYKYWGYPKVARNALESVNAQSAEGSTTDATHPIAERPLNPRCLWVQDPSSKKWQKVIVEDWLGSNGHAMINFILVAYTAQQFDHDSQDDIDALHQIARRAALDADVQAYWCADSCMSKDPVTEEQDVYRISDVIRAAQSLTIAVKQPNDATSTWSDGALMRNWGSRMWCFPEALLGPKDRPVTVYRAEGPAISLVRTADRRQLPAMLWKDAPLTRQLVDHYEGNITLSRLELVILAMKALSQRETSAHLPGDLAYILMGLLRRRPHVDRTDSLFQAFARLSLANDSDRLLERLICVQPARDDQPWFITDDIYRCNLWDIEPTCQIAAICDNDTVVLDGCFGAAIKWETFLAPWHERKRTWKRMFADLFIRSFTILFLIAIFLILIGAAQKASSDAAAAASSSSSSSSSSSTILNSLGFKFSKRQSSSYYTTYAPPDLLTTGGILLGISFPFWLLAPWAVRILFGGKAWNIAPYYFGFEGYLDIETVESQIYGFPCNRLRWSVAGSPLSHHAQNEFGECLGTDPVISDAAVAETVERAKHAAFGEKRVFTLVDTRNGLVTLFESVRPPCAMLLCGQEGGMQRSVLVSLDWKTGTLYREAVVRVPTVVLQDMWRVDRVRVGLRREVEEVVGCRSEGV